MNEGNIAEEACQGTESCSDNKNDIGTQSCLGLQSCKSNTEPIGNGSCNVGRNSCSDNGGAIGDGSVSTIMKKISHCMAISTKDAFVSAKTATLAKKIQVL